MSNSFGLGMAGGNAMNLGDTFSQDEFSRENAARLERERYARLLAEDGQLEYYADQVREAAEALQKASDEARELTYEACKGFISAMGGLVHPTEAQILAGKFRRQLIESILESQQHSLDYAKECHDRYYAQNYGTELEF